MVVSYGNGNVGNVANENDTFDYVGYLALLRPTVPLVM